MKYIINSHGQLKIQDHKRDKVLVIVENKSGEWKINQLTKLVAQSDNELKIQYIDEEGKERVKTFSPKGGTKQLVNILFTECVGCGNTKIKKLT